MATIELKPCPFCGAAAEPPYKEKPRLGQTMKPIWEVSCSWHCVAMYRGSRKEVVKDWNKRV
jgi:hypothetical protein